MKELKELKDIYLEEFDIHVKRYLTISQIQKIIDEALMVGNFEERESIIDYLTLCYCTDIGQKEIDELGPDILIQSGLMDKVKESIINWNKLNEGLVYHESTGRALRMIAKQMPDNWGDLISNDILQRDRITGSDI